jgi:nitroreductase
MRLLLPALPKGASMTAKSRTTTSSPKASAKTKPAARPKAAPKKASATRTAKATRLAASVEPMESVKPLLRVRQAREFTGKRVTKAELEAITEVARWSGSSRNEQPCRFITLRDPELIRRIAELGLPQTRGLPTATAAVVIVEPNEPERGISRAFDDGRAAERVLIAAHLLGLGGGISRVRPDVREGIDKVLRLPSNRSVRTIVALGHPTGEARAPKSPPGKARFPREEVIYEESWPDAPLQD